jgi:protein-S-isoprenylcysteine O-methyltransferase Ste14
MKKLFIPPLLILLSLALIILFYFLFPSLNLIPFPYNFLGLLVALSGFIIMGKARELFKKHQTTMDFKESSSLIQEGIFLKTRNPMYLGMFLLLFGIAICFRNILSLAIPFLFLAIIILVFIPREDKLLTEKFGQEYLEYKRKVGNI